MGGRNRQGGRDQDGGGERASFSQRWLFPGCGTHSRGSCVVARRMVAPHLLGRERVVIDRELVDPADEGAWVLRLERVGRPASDDQAAREWSDGRARRGIVWSGSPSKEQLQPIAVLLRHNVVPAAGDVQPFRDDVVADPGVEGPAMEEPDRRRLEQRTPVVGRQLHAGTCGRGGHASRGGGNPSAGRARRARRSESPPSRNQSSTACPGVRVSSQRLSVKRNCSGSPAWNTAHPFPPSVRRRRPGR